MRNFAIFSGIPGCIRAHLQGRGGMSEFYIFRPVPRAERLALRGLMLAAWLTPGCEFDERQTQPATSLPTVIGNLSPDASASVESEAQPSAESASSKVGTVEPSAGGGPARPLDAGSDPFSCCFASGDCVAAGVPNPENLCQVCAPDRNAAGWSSNDGVPCNDGLFCTVEDVCGASTCTGVPRPCEDGVGCNGVSACSEDAGACSADENQCDELALCDVSSDECVTTCAGCVVEGVCLAAGAAAANNPCLVCDPQRSTASLSVAEGAACGSGPAECSAQDTCDALGQCLANHLPLGASCGMLGGQCDAADACNGSGVCVRQVAAAGSPCNDGLFCTDGDSCQGGQCLSGGPRNCGNNAACDETSDACVTRLAGAGEPCADNSGCADGRQCVFSFVDLDGDGFGSGAPIGVCGSGAPNVALALGASFVGAGGDCCDAGARAELVFPGQERYFTGPSPCGNFDYDCDGEETLMPVLSCTEPASVACEFRVILQFGPVTPGTACGVDGRTYVQCEVADGMCVRGAQAELPSHCR